MRNMLIRLRLFLISLIKHIGILDSILILSVAVFIPLSIYLEPVKGSRNSVILLAGVATVLFTLLLTIKRRIDFPKRFSLIFFTFLIWGFLGTLFSLYLGDSIIEMIRLISLFFLFISIYTLTVKKPYIFFIFLTTIALATIPLLIHDIVDFLLSDSLQSGKYFIGSFYWHNQMAGFLLFLIPLYAALGIENKKRFFKVFWFFLTLLSAIFLVLTYSRGAWLSFLGSLFLVSLISFSSYRKHLKKIFIVGLLVIALAFLLKPTTLTNQLQSIPQELFQKTRTVSGTFRVTALQSAFHMTQQHPLFGVGPGVFGEAFYSYQTVPWLYGRHAHNHYMQMASEMGIVGFILYLSLFITLFFVFWKKRKSFSGKKNVLLLGIMAAITASSLHALMDFDWSITPLYALFWIFVSFSLSQTNVRDMTIKITGRWKLLYIPPILFLFFVLVIALGEKFYTSAKDDLFDKDITQASQDIDKSLQFNPVDAQIYLLKADILTRKKDIAEAKAMYEKSLSLSRLSAEPYYQLGLFALQEKKYANAETYFSKAIATNPYSHPKLYDGLANTYNAEKKYIKAETVLTEAIENAFPLNQSYKDFSYIYTAIGFQFDLATTYTELVSVKLKLGKEKEADIIFTRMKRDLLKITPTPRQEKK